MTPWVATALIAIIFFGWVVLLRRREKNMDAKLNAKFREERKSALREQLDRQLRSLSFILMGSYYLNRDRNKFPSGTTKDSIVMSIADRFFRDYLTTIKPEALKVVDEHIIDLNWFNYEGDGERPFVLVPDLGNKRVYMICKIFCCSNKDEDWQAREGKLGKAIKNRRRKLSENEKLRLKATGESRYSNCHICHSEDGGVEYHYRYHDEHESCHQKQFCEPSCDADMVYYFVPFDEAELTQKVEEEMKKQCPMPND